MRCSTWIDLDNRVSICDGKPEVRGVSQIGLKSKHARST